MFVHDVGGVLFLLRHTSVASLFVRIPPPTPASPFLPHRPRFNGSLNWYKCETYWFSQCSKFYKEKTFGGKRVRAAPEIGPETSRERAVQGGEGRERGLNGVPAWCRKGHRFSYGRTRRHRSHFRVHNDIVTPYTVFDVLKRVFVKVIAREERIIPFVPVFVSFVSVPLMTVQIR